MSKTPAALTPVSWGELIDKITILEIKRARLTDAAKRANVEHELALLSAVAAPAANTEGLAQLKAQLASVNAALWEIEDDIRREETRGEFGAAFVALARAVYRRNDERAAVKREINALLASDIVEEKSYQPY